MGLVNRWKYNSDLPSLYIFIFWDNLPDYPSQGASCFAGLYFPVGFLSSDALCSLAHFPQLTLLELNVCTCVCTECAGSWTEGEMRDEGILEGGIQDEGMRDAEIPAPVLGRPPGARSGCVSAGAAAEGAVGQGMARRCCRCCCTSQGFNVIQ